MMRLGLKAGDDVVALNETLDLQAVFIGRTTTKANQVGSKLILKAL